MDGRDNELEKLEKLAESFSTMGDFTQVMRDSYSRLESRYEDVNTRLARVNELLRQSLSERNRLAHYLHDILESLNTGVIVTDQTGQINVFNSAAESYTGISSSKALGLMYHEIIDIGEPGIKEASRLAAGESISGEISLFPRERQHIKAAYSIMRLRESGSDELSGLVLILYDLTEVKKLEENLKRISTLAALGEMAATVAHEIRNPLSGISGFAKLLLRDLEPGSETRRLVEKINEGVESLGQIVTSLLDYTRTVTPEMAESDPLKIIEHAISDIKTEPDSANQTFEIRAGSRRLKAVLDPHLIRLVIFNLLKNAVQACPSGGKIKISLSRSETGILRISVEDKGPGITPEAMEKLFVPFFTTKSAGTGLGLATVKKLTEIHNGRVSAQNSPDGGAIFTVEIPSTIEGDAGEA
jgi:PAS domain S-box-containing protein